MSPGQYKRCLPKRWILQEFQALDTKGARLWLFFTNVISVESRTQLLRLPRCCNQLPHTKWVPTTYFRHNSSTTPCVNCLSVTTTHSTHHQYLNHHCRPFVFFVTSTCIYNSGVDVHTHIYRINDLHMFDFMFKRQVLRRVYNQALVQNLPCNTWLPKPLRICR